MDVVSTTGLVLTIIALLLTGLQFRSARSHLAELDAIRRSMSTRYIGEFPTYLPELVRMLSQAHSSITIACGVVTYGLFSDRSNWLRYRAVLEQQIHAGVAVSIISANETGRRQHQIDQFGLTRSWPELLRDDLFTSRLSIFSTHYASGDDYHKWSPETIVDLLELQQKHAIESDFAAALHKESPDRLALHYWIVDELSAVFSIPRFGEAPTELGFITSDARLIQAFQTMHRRSSSASPAAAINGREALPR
jgi:hypothetical protein